jgi:putative peptidoglycan lipid II flippase
LDAEAGEEVGRHDAIDALFSRIASALLGAGLLLVASAEVFTEPLVQLWVDGFDAVGVEATARLTRIVLPAQLFFLFGGLLQATLIARQRFAALALTPLFYNGGIIVGGIVGAWTGEIEGFSWGALVGAAVGALAVPLYYARDAVRFRPTWPRLDADVRAFLWTALPLMVGVSLTTVDEWLGVRFGSRLGEGAISWLGSARRLVLVPIGLVGTAAGQATGAYVARLYAEGKRDELAELLGRALGGVLGLSLLLSGFAIAAAEPIVGLLFEHGRFHRADTVATAAVLQPLALGIGAWGLHSVAARSLYGVGDTWRPMIASSVVTLASLPVYAAGVEHDGLRGLALAGVVGMSAQAVVLCVLVGRRLGARSAPLRDALLRGVPVAALSGGAAMGAMWTTTSTLPTAWVDPTAGAAALAYGVQLAAAGGGWLAVVLALGPALGLPGAEVVVRRLRGVAGRLRRATLRRR